MSARLTSKQRAALTVVVDYTCNERRGWISGPALARRLDDTTPQGAHQTAASLVRRGLLEKGYGNSQVVYRITADGLRASR